MPEPLAGWIGWAAITFALLAFFWAVNVALDWISERRQR